MEITYEIKKTDRGNFRITAYKKTDKTYLGEIKTQRTIEDIEFNTVSITDVRSNEYFRKQGIAKYLYVKLLSVLPENIKGIRMSDIVLSMAINKIYDELGSIEYQGQKIIPNPNYVETHKLLGSAKELGIALKIEGHDMIAKCDCGEKFSYQNSKKDILWQCPECNGMKRIKIS